MESNDSKQGMQPQNATLCKAGCGFYGSASSDGYCSVCFKSKLQRCMLHAEGVSSSSSSSSSSSNQPSSNCSQNESDEKVNNVQTSNDDSNAAPQTTVDTTAQASANLEEVVEDHSNPSTPVKDGDGSIKDTSLEPLDLRKKPLEDEEVEKVSEDESSKKKNRCSICKKKVGLTGFGCRCGGLFCGLHRYSDTHGCTFDYKEQGQLEIRKNNPKVTFQKVAKI